MSAPRLLALSAALLASSAACDRPAAPAADRAADAQARAAAQPIPTPTPPSAPPAAKGATPAAPAVPGDGAAPPPPPGPGAGAGPSPTVAGVPDLVLGPVPAAATTTSARANAAALKLHRRKKLAAAIPLYLRALQANPANLFARYNLACAYSLTGKTEEALGLLQQLAAGGCLECQRRIIRAREDQDFAPLAADARFRRLVDHARVDSPTLAPAARALAEAMTRGDDATLRAVVGKGWPVEVVFEEENLGDGPNRIRKVRLRSEADVAALIARHRPGEELPIVGFQHGDEIACKEECCTLEPVLCGGAGDESSWITSICFRSDTTDEPVAARIDAFTCGGN